MTPEEWQRVRPILESALDLQVAERPAFLEAACPDSSVRMEVESLLASHEQAGTDVLNPGSPASVDFEEEARYRLPAGKRIGAYEIVQEIGMGGMGAIYSAVRADGEYRQQVALKIVRAELGVEFTAARFKNERQILASLDHANIAKILDGGTTSEGVPYLVMELVDGLPITEYCDEHGLGVDARLDLFRTVCSAVHYAHQHLVIHRDIKPTNIFITAEGVPKLLDFGIAKILDPSLLPENATLTAAGSWLMTPDYASPEQFRGGAITTATDVYSLGLVLYELLTGQRAFRAGSRMPHDMARAVLETDPEKPSTAIRRTYEEQRGAKEAREKGAADADALGSHRRETLDGLERRLRGDLDNIVMKAIQKEPAARYSSADQLSEDLRRHVEGLPVLARKSTVAYRCRKYVLRHKVGVGAAALVFLSLLTGIALMLREARIARADELRAERRFNDVRALANALIFDVHDSIKDLPGSTPARKLIVDRALLYLDGLAKESGSDQGLQRELATAYERVGLVQGHYLQNSLGDTKGSLASYQKALDIRQHIAAASSDWKDRLALAKTHSSVANQQWALGDNRDAFYSAAKAITISEGLNASHPRDWDILNELAFDYQLTGMIPPPEGEQGYGNPKWAEEGYRKSIAIDDILLQLRPDDLGAQYGYVQNLRHVAYAFVGVNDAAALEMNQKELALAEKLHAAAPDVRYARGAAFAHSDLSQQCERIGNLACALENDQQSLEIYKELVGQDPKNTLLQQGLAIAYTNTATMLSKTGNAAASLKYMDQGLEIMRSVVSSSPQNARQRDILAAVYVSRGSIRMRLHNPNAAFAEFNQAHAIYESLQKGVATTESAPVKAAACAKQMGEVAAETGNGALAADYFHKALTVVEPMVSAQAADPDALYTAADAYSGLGDLKRREARRAEENHGEQTRSWNEARSWYLKSLAVWHRIEHPRREAPNGFDVGDPSKVAANLRLSEAALAKLGATAP